MLCLNVIKIAVNETLNLIKKFVSDGFAWLDLNSLNKL